MPPEPSTAAYFWLWPLVFIGVPVLIGISMLCRLIFDRVSAAWRAKLNILFTIAFWTVVIVGTAALVWWRPWLLVQIILGPIVIVVGGRCFSSRSRQSRTLWGFGIASLAAGILFGNATAHVAQYRAEIVLGIVVCAISALLSGFCFGRLASRGPRTDGGMRPRGEAWES